MLLGAHIGISGGIERSPAAACSIGCQCMQVFSKNQRQWRVPDIVPETARLFREAVVREGIAPVAAHASYLLNLASQDEKLKGMSRAGLIHELQRAEVLGIDYVVLHPGAHVGAGTEKGLSTIAEGARLALEATEGAHVKLLLETAAGAGTTLGRTFEELQVLFDSIDVKDRVGCCLDTCHVFVSGIDFRTEKGYEGLIDRVESTIGLSTVHLFHLNDAKFDLGSNKDRHANIGEGNIGPEGFRWLVNDRRLAKKAGVLETPVSEDKDHPYSAYERDLATLRSLTSSPHSGSRPKPPRK